MENHRCPNCNSIDLEINIHTGNEYCSQCKQTVHFGDKTMPRTIEQKKRVFWLPNEPRFTKTVFKFIPQNGIKQQLSISVDNSKKPIEFKDNLVVERDTTDLNRVNVLCPSDVINSSATNSKPEEIYVAEIYNLKTFGTPSIKTLSYMSACPQCGSIHNHQCKFTDDQIEFLTKKENCINSHATFRNSPDHIKVIHKWSCPMCKAKLMLSRSTAFQCAVALKRSLSADEIKQQLFIPETKLATNFTETLTRSIEDEMPTIKEDQEMNHDRAITIVLKKLITEDEACKIVQLDGACPICGKDFVNFWAFTKPFIQKCTERDLTRHVSRSMEYPNCPECNKELELPHHAIDEIAVELKSNTKTNLETKKKPSVRGSIQVSKM